MTKIQPDQIKVGAGPEHTLPKYGAAPGYELEASRILDDDTNINLSSRKFNAGDFGFANNGTLIRLDDETPTVYMAANESGFDSTALLSLTSAPGTAILKAVEGSAEANLSLVPGTLEAVLGFIPGNVGTVRLVGESVELAADDITIGESGNANIVLNSASLKNNGIQLGTAVSISQTGQTASIGTTNIRIAAAVLVAGLYRLSYYLVTTTPGTSGTVKATFAWGDIAAARSVDSAVITFGSLAAPASGTLIIQTDGSTDLTYATTVADAVGDPQYALFITLERLQ